MKKVFIFLIFITVLTVKINSECQFENSDNIRNPIELELNESNPSHLPLEIMYDFNKINSQSKNNPNVISESYLNTIKLYLKKSAIYLKELFIMNERHKIKFEENIEDLCNNTRINFYSKQYKKGINADFLIYPYFDFKEKKQFSTAGICAIEKKTKRPIIAYIKLRVGYKDEILIKNEDYFIPNILHQLIHILGFNKKSMDYFGYNKAKRVSYIVKLGNNYFSTTYKATKAFTVLRGTYSTYIALSKNENDYNPHWNKRSFVLDLMKINNYSNLPLTRITIGTLLDSNWYFQRYYSKKCNLYIKSFFGNCLLFNGECITDSNKFGYVIYYFYKNDMRCAIFDAKKNMTYNDLGLVDYYKLKIYYTNDANYKCPIDKTKYLTDLYNKNFKETFDKISEQKINLYIPNNHICKCPMRTVFFKYPPFIPYKQDLSKINYTPITIKEKEYFITVQEKTYLSTPFCVNETLRYNNIIKVNNSYMSNYVYDEKCEFLETYSKYQKYNHHKTFYVIHNKERLYQLYMKQKELFNEEYDYMPESYTLPKDKKIFDEKFKNFELNLNNIYLVKPTQNSQGRGIYILENPKEITGDCLVTKYISNPGTLKGRKYDLRLYVLVTSYNPIIIYLHNNGIVRIASEEYKLDLKTLKNLWIHLTNTSFNEKNKEKFGKNEDPEAEEGNEWTVKTLKKHLLKKGKNVKKIFEDIKVIIAKTIFSIRNTELNLLGNNYNILHNTLYEIYGFDILIDSNDKPWLIEVNYNPSLESYSMIDKVVKSSVYLDMYNILGLIPFSHIDEKTLDKECVYKNLLEQIVEESICELNRAFGGFERVFPKKDNVDKLGKLVVNPGERNLALWNRIKNMDDF